VDTGSREDNASRQTPRAPCRFHRNVKGYRRRTPELPEPAESLRSPAKTRRSGPKSCSKRPTNRCFLTFS